MLESRTLLALLTLLAWTSPARAQSDPWFGRDKALHFGVSVGLGLGGYGVVAPQTERRDSRFLLGAGLAFSAGLGKEMLDATGRGDASERDLAWDAAGSAVGAAVGLALDWLLSGAVSDRRLTDAPHRGTKRSRKVEENMGALDGKVAIVTGAAGGIGRATALLFAKQGARVIVNDVGGPRDGSGGDETAAGRVVAEIVQGGGTASASTHSVASREGAEGLVQTAVERYGRLDVLVNNAGILRDKTLLKMDDEMWDAVVDVHLKGTFLCMQAAARQMKEQGAGGRIVNTTSVSGMLGNFGQANYAAAKAGIYGLTRTGSIELQRYGITVNAVAPIAKTRMTEDLPMFQKVDTLTADHVAPAHLFFASDLCGDRSGLVLSVAGGKMSVFRVVESPGKFKEGDGGVWTAEEIAEHWESIDKL